MAFDVTGRSISVFPWLTVTADWAYITPPNVVEFMVDAVDPKIGQKIVDEFCGTGAFLIYAFEVVSEKIRLPLFSEYYQVQWKT